MRSIWENVAYFVHQNDYVPYNKPLVINFCPRFATAYWENWFFPGAIAQLVKPDQEAFDEGSFQWVMVDKWLWEARQDCGITYAVSSKQSGMTPEKTTFNLNILTEHLNTAAHTVH